MFFTLFPSLAARRVFQLRGDDDDVFQGSLVLTQHAYDEGVGTGEFECRQDCLVLAGIVRLDAEVLLLSVPPVRKCGKS